MGMNALHKEKYTPFVCDILRATAESERVELSLSCDAITGISFSFLLCQRNSRYRMPHTLGHRMHVSENVRGRTMEQEQHVLKPAY